MSRHQFEYDAIVVGSSFAALSVAATLRCKALIVSNREIGSFQTSACGTPEDLVRGLGCADSIHETYDTATVHIGERRSWSYTLPRSFCVFDYAAFCKSLMPRVSAEFRLAEVLGSCDHSVITSSGTYTGQCIVDCSGWKAVLGRSKDPSLVDRKTLIRAVETLSRPGRRIQGMHFWLNPSYQGYAWAFPRGREAGLGIGVWGREGDLFGLLGQHCRALDADMLTTHGGHLPSALRKGVVGDIFMVGDSAGQSLPLTGEGIRPAIYFGQVCGQIVQRIADGEMSLKDGLARYATIVEGVRSSYRTLEWLQDKVMTPPGTWVSSLLTLTRFRPFRARILQRYCRPLARQ